MRTELCPAAPQASIPLLPRRPRASAVSNVAGIAVLAGLWPATYADLIGMYVAALIPVLLLALIRRREDLGASLARRRWLRQRRREVADQQRRIDIAEPTRVNEHRELAAVVEEVELGSTGELASLQLSELLARYVQLIEARHRLLGAASLAEDPSGSGVQADEGGRVERDEEQSWALRTRLSRRRSQLASACRERAVQLEGELEATAEFIRLVGSHVNVSPLDLDAGGDTIGGKLDELDELLEARQELATVKATRPRLASWPSLS